MYKELIPTAIKAKGYSQIPAAPIRPRDFVSGIRALYQHQLLLSRDIETTLHGLASQPEDRYWRARLTHSESPPRRYVIQAVSPDAACALKVVVLPKTLPWL